MPKDYGYELDYIAVCFVMENLTLLMCWFVRTSAATVPTCASYATGWGSGVPEYSGVPWHAATAVSSSRQLPK